MKALALSQIYYDIIFSPLRHRRFSSAKPVGVTTVDEDMFCRFAVECRSKIGETTCRSVRNWRKDVVLAKAKKHEKVGDFRRKSRIKVYLIEEKGLLWWLLEPRRKQRGACERRRESAIFGPIVVVLILFSSKTTKNRWISWVFFSRLEFYF